MRKNLHLLIVLLLTISKLLNAQEITVLKGVVLEKGSENPIPFANISVCNFSIGTASNEFGEFVLKIPGNLINKNLCISSLGYETFTSSITNLVTNDYNIIRLEIENYEINEAIVTEKLKRKFSNPITIVELTIENIQKNYPFKPYYIKGYYREYAKYNDNNYLNLLEAAIIKHDKGFNNASSENTNYLLQYRYNNNFKKIEALESLYKNDLAKIGTFKFIPGHTFPETGGNELSVLYLHDPIRRYNKESFSFIDQLNKDFIENHVFKLDKIDVENNIPVYQISFKYKDNIKYDYPKHDYHRQFDIKGKIFIESNSYAIKRIEYTSYSINNLNLKNYEVVAKYKKYNGKMYLNYLSFSNSFDIKTLSANLSALNLPLKETPLKITDAFIKDETLVLEFNKDLKKFSVRKRNINVNGSISWRNHLTNKDLEYIPSKHPHVNYLKSEKKIFINIPNINQIAYKKINFNKSNINIGDLTVSVDDIKDQFGNKINENRIITMYQFRELYVNEVGEKLDIPKFARIIFPRIPLYDQKPVEVKEFWESFNYPYNKPLQNNTRIISKK